MNYNHKLNDKYNPKDFEEKIYKETEEKVKSMQRNLQDRNNQKMQKEYELRTLTEQGEEYSRQIRERQVIMQYLELDDTYLWNDGKIMEWV